jgi:hypothetical protein
VQIPHKLLHRVLLSDLLEEQPDRSLVQMFELQSELDIIKSEFPAIEKRCLTL